MNHASFIFSANFKGGAGEVTRRTDKAYTHAWAVYNIEGECKGTGFTYAPQIAMVIAQRFARSAEISNPQVEVVEVVNVGLMRLYRRMIERELEKPARAARKAVRNRIWMAQQWAAQKRARPRLRQPVWVQKKDWVSKRAAILVERLRKASYVRYLEADDPQRARLVSNRYITERDQ